MDAVTQPEKYCKIIGRIVHPTPPPYHPTKEWGGVDDAY